MLDTELEVIAHLDDFEELPCESVLHDSWPHNGAATYWQQGPCAHTTGYRCAGVTSYLLAAGYRRACFCGVETPAGSVTFTPIS